jgi:predicted nucleic acid-binding protein
LIIQATHSDWLDVYNVTLQMNNLSSKLDTGEKEVIALAIEINERKVLLDEKEARRVAQEFGLQII